ncbi:hypothetical protein SARC_13543, partial [Sphaeroforma arctica JP610]
GERLSERGLDHSFVSGMKNRSESMKNRSMRSVIPEQTIGQKYFEAYTFQHNRIFYSHISGFRQHA